LQNTKINRGDLLNKVSSGINLLSAQENSKELFQLKKLAYKIQNHESYFVFCGHFSAGKSSLLNDLLHVEKLPTSPIPTSANVVKLKNGENNLLLTLKNGEMYQLEDDIEGGELKKLAQDSASIIEIEWWQDMFKIPKGVVLIDTPGIDSTDMDHLEATNSVIHLADCIFYLMDYQHVHSKTNIDFINGLMEKNNKVCLMITCIDKHDETELTFEEFKEGVVSNLKKQGLEKLTVFYLSIKVKNANHNELNQFMQYLDGLYRTREEQQIENDYTSFLNIMGDQIVNFENEKTELDSDFSQFKDEFSEVTDEMAKLQDGITTFESNCSQSTQLILNNSNITPFEMRNLASVYLETEKALQNKGFFQSRKKLEIASDEAKQQFIKNVHELTIKQIEYFIKEAATKSFKEIENNKIDLSQFENILEPKLSESDLCPKPAQLVNTSGNYLLQYTKEVSDGIKSIYRKSIIEFIQAVSKEMKLQNEKQNSVLEIRKIELSGMINEFDRIDFKNHQLDQMIYEIKNIIENKQDEVPFYSPIVPISISVDELMERNILSNEIQTEEKSFEDVESQKLDVKKYSNEEINSKYEIADNLLKNLSNNKFVKNKIHNLLEKREQIKSNEYTIALFGAFSSGKTSYINTLLGERVLPVSPHPTTAAICKIKKSTIDSDNKKADVTYKSELALQEEFLDFFKKWGVETNDHWFSTLQTVTKKQKDKIPADAWIYADSVCMNYLQMKEILGTTQQYDLEEYVRVISEENRACFVKESTVYYDCEITQSGIVLVDTPGGNSIHSRHTELAFDYLKKADLILYVAHYQHAFTRQDESFLIQIGRMRESFDSDKVYFVLNASDLAKDSAEISIVQNFFINQLTKLGVRFPSVYAISSMLQMKGYQQSSINEELKLNYQRLNEKIKNFFQFEIANEVFKTFVNDLLMIEKILLDTIKRFERLRLEKDQFLSELEKIKVDVNNSLQASMPSSLPRSFMKENEQLIFFIEKRIELRMRDLFPYFFNPSIFNNSTKNSKEIFNTKIREFMYEVLEEILKELRVTGFRLEKFLMSEILNVENRIIDELQTIQTEFTIQKTNVSEINSVELLNPDQYIDVNTFENLKSHYKNPKSFFVENKKELMLDECIEQLRTPLKSYLSSIEKLFTEHYQIQFTNTMSTILNHFKKQIENDVHQTIEATSNLDEQIVDEITLNQFKNLS